MDKSDNFRSHYSHQSYHIFCGPDHPGSYVVVWGERVLLCKRALLRLSMVNTSNSNCSVCHTDVLMLQARRGYRHCSHTYFSLKNFTQHWLLYLWIVNEWDWKTVNYYINCPFIGVLCDWMCTHVFLSKFSKCISFCIVLNSIP